MTADKFFRELSVKFSMVNESLANGNCCLIIGIMQQSFGKGNSYLLIKSENSHFLDLFIVPYLLRLSYKFQKLRKTIFA